MKHKAGIFDSGIGGFSVLFEIVRKVPCISIDYISDDYFAPYGEKSDHEIIERSILITEMLLERGATIVVVACNSATAAAIASLRQRYPTVPFVGVEPYVNVLNHGKQFPGITKAAVITTTLTGKSKKFRALKKRIDPENRILHMSMPDLATIVENIVDKGMDSSLQSRLIEELSPLTNLGLSHLILGCTHYPLIADLIQKELGVTTVSAGPYVANRVYNILNSREGNFCSSFSFLSTGSMNWETKNIDDLAPMLKYSCINL